MKQLLIIVYLFLVSGVIQAYTISGLTYDPNGNIELLNRNDADGNVRHNLNYNYQGIDNQLTSVSGYSTYEYDVIGRLTEATKTGQNTIGYTYNSDGLLGGISDKTTQTLEMSFGYDEAYRIKKQKHGVGGETTWYVRDINGNLLAIYSDATTQIQVPLYGASRVGMYNRSGNVFQYELKDHLGNVRVVINKPLIGEKTIDSYKDYYPFGLALRAAGSGYRYGYQGDFAEDETDEFGLNSFMLRYYDPVLGRWLTPDPARQYASPYLGMGNNPVIMTDPTGGVAGKENPIYSSDGVFRGTDEFGLQGEAIIYDGEFTQGTTTQEEILNNGGAFYSNSNISFDAGYRLLEHFQGLPNRPDYDGIVTDLEARKWYNDGSGDPLFIDIEQLSLKPFSTASFHADKGYRMRANFFLIQLSDSRTARVHGTLTMKLKDVYTGEVGLFRDDSGFFDTYDFNSDGRVLRDITTWGARKIVGEGVGYGFYPYGNNPRVPQPY